MTSERQDPAKFKVLLVDDNPDMRDTFRMILGQAGYPVETYEIGSDLLDRLATVADSVGVVFLDQKLDGDEEAGLDLLQQIKERHPLIPVIIYTAATDHECRLEAYDRGAFLYLFKPDAGPAAIANLAEALVGLREAYVRKQEVRFLQTIIDALDVEVFVRDRDRNILWVNQRKLDNLGLTREDLAGKNSSVFAEATGGDADGGRDREADTYQDCFFTEPPSRNVIRWNQALLTDGKPDFLHVVGRRAEVAGRRVVVEQALRQTNMTRALRLAAELQAVSYQDVGDFLKTFGTGLLSLGYKRCRIYSKPIECAGYQVAKLLYEIDEERALVLDQPVRVRASEASMRLAKEFRPTIIEPAKARDALDSESFDRLRGVREVLYFSVGSSDVRGFTVALDKGAGPHRDDEGLIDPADILPIEFLAQVAEGHLRILRERRMMLALDTLDRRIMAATTAAGVLKAIIESAKHVFGADEAALLVPNYETKVFETVELGRDREHQLQEHQQNINAGIAGRALRERRIQAVADCQADPDLQCMLASVSRKEHQNLCSFDPSLLKSALKAPVFSIKKEEHVVAVLSVSFRGRTEFDEEDIELAGKLCARIALAYARFETLNTLELGTVVAAQTKALALLAEGIAHGIQTPLLVLGNEIANLAAKQETPADLPERLARMKAKVEESRNLIANLRCFAGLDDNASTLDGRFDVYGTVNAFVDQLKHELKRKRIEVDLSEMLVLPRVRHNPDALRSCIYNLLTNAVDALSSGPAEGRILKVSARCTDIAGITLSVHDNGAPIPPRIRDHLFLPFNTTKQGSGMGLGLAIAKQVAERIGGSLELSQNDETGKTFTLCIPIADEKGQ